MSRSRSKATSRTRRRESTLRTARPDVQRELSFCTQQFQRHPPGRTTRATVAPKWLLKARGVAADHKDCVDSITTEAECSKAVSISKGYAECTDTIRSATCDDVYSVADDGTLQVNDLPPVCDGVILTK
jgi:hypothetical protein